MPIGGSNIGWDSTTPADGESAGLGDDRIRSLKTSVQEALANEHNFPSGGGANTGYHLLGSARPYYGLQSAVSSSGSDGRLMLTSDTSRLFAVGSVATSFLGGPTVISAGSYPGGTPPQRHYWAMEFGRADTGASGSTTVTIPNSGFSGAPHVVACSHYTTTPIVFSNIVVSQRLAASFDVFSFDATGAALANRIVDWFSIGTRAL